jgi:hypothetical protein
LEILAESLYKKVTIDKITIAQTNELVEFRTRHAVGTFYKALYPFDDRRFTNESSTA